MKMPRVVVTGYGCVSPVAKTARETYSAVCQKESGFRKLADIPNLKNPDQYPLAQYVASVDLTQKEFDTFAHRFVKTRSCAFLQMSLKEALEHAQVSKSFIDSNRKAIGVSVGALSSNLTFLTENILKAAESGFDSIHRMTMMNVLNNIHATLVAVELGLQGPSVVPSTACATGLSAIGEAYNLLRLNFADMFIVGATEETLNPTSVWGAKRMGTLNTDDSGSKICAPFDFQRKGIILGEGAGIIVLETLDSALKRKANIIAEVMGYGISTDGNHFVKPDEQGEGAFTAMKNALLASGIDLKALQSSQIFVNAHATGTAVGDKAEAVAIERLVSLLQMHSPFEQMQVTAHKGNFGHCFSAAGIIESIIGIQSLQHSVIAPINNFEKTEIESPTLHMLNQPINNTSLRVMIKNSFGFGGINNSIVFRKFEE